MAAHDAAGHDAAGLMHAISAAVAKASATRPLTVLELTASGSVTFHVTCDEIGVAAIRRSEPVTWESMGYAGSVPVPSGDLIIVDRAMGASQAAWALRRLRAARPDAPAWEAPAWDAAALETAATSVAELLAEAAAGIPIRQDYELLAVRADPGANRVRLTSEPLFAAGASRGDVAALTIARERPGPGQTVLAVVARDGDTPRLLSAGQVTLPPGRHRVRAELLGPGLVGFTEPAAVTPYGGSVPELIAAVPRSLNTVERAHLICGIEISGAASAVAARLYRAERLIKSLHKQLPEPGQLAVSVIGYGAHRFDRRRPQQGVIVTDWMAPAVKALRSVGWLGAAELGYPGAAQIEDMLAELTRRLIPAADEPWPTALLVFGARPPHPAQHSDGLLPCPSGHDWQRRLHALIRFAHVRVAAIRDDLAAAGSAAWAQLGDATLLALNSVDEAALGEAIGFVAPAPLDTPFPMADDPAA